MNRYMLGAALTVVSLAMTAPAGATELNGSSEILCGNFPAAEQVIGAQLATHPTDPDLIFNLAYVYRHTGRTSEARALYQSVLSRPNEVVETDTRGTHWAHTLAQAALQETGGQQLTAR